jgi:hypothetical protein
VVLMRPQTQGLGTCLELATAAARWRPNGDVVRVASAGNARKEGEQKWKERGATRGDKFSRRWCSGEPRRR